jgi:predicted MFS family arabinose efflux permease
VLADLQVLRLRPYRLLLSAQTVSLLGSAIAPVALAFAVLGQPGGSATQLGLVLAARSLAQVVFLLAGGVLADRLPRLRLMAVSNLLACGAQGGIAAMFITHAAPLPAVVALSAGNGAAAALFLPASKGVIPQLVPAGQLQPANALMRLSRNSTAILGAAAGGILVAAIGPGWALALDAASFAAATVLIAGIRTVLAGRVVATTMVADLREGWQEFRQRAWVWLLVGQFAFVNGCFAAVNVLGPVLARQYLGGAPAWGAVLSAMAVGLVSGSLIALRLRPAFPLRVAAAATFGFLPPFLVLALHAPLWLVAASMLVNGVCVDIFEVLWDTALQTHVPNHALARISSYDALGSFVLGPLGLAIAGPVAAAIGVTPTLAGAGALLAVASVMPLLTPAVRRLPAAPAPPAVAPPSPGPGPAAPPEAAAGR